MTQNTLYFGIPTNRLRDVSDTVTAYDENFWHNGHSVPIMIFDDSSIANHEKYFPNLEEIKTYNEVFYIGPAEKEQFIGLICRRLRDRKLEALVRNLFRPSYGGNRNFSLMYTIGDHFVSSDDDMRPFALIEDSPESLGEGEISRGKLINRRANGHTRRSFDIIQSFRDILGKTAFEAPSNYERGELLIDSSMDLESNTSLGFVRENSLGLQAGKVPKHALVKIAQTFRTGTNDIDAVDYLSIFLEDESSLDPEALNDSYVLVNFRPCVTNRNWRMDCGVAGYDNSHGLPPFFPIRLRFEDYIYRLWIQQPNVISAHVDSAQTHIKSNYMRSPLAAEIFNESICSLLKNKIRMTLSRVEEHGIQFDYDGYVSLQDSADLLDQANHLLDRIAKAAQETEAPDRVIALKSFSENLRRSLYDLEPDFFQQNVSRIVSEEVSLIKSALELWPTLLEIAYFQRKGKALPMRRVKTKAKVAQRAAS
ncbi:hypothetical protein [Acidisoma silvae]|uniref:Uncharacterized protein n=1 Tax=Acidisoma silvae TaxID=2802396 RepID=A0A963YQZ2_9PROT|nr:hypothetical protein [Acidisoma silvae]MCB8875362.1 hypothetical protein [Acidisoma silvae]